MNKQLDGFRNENLDLKATVRDLKKEKMILTNNTMLQQNQLQNYQDNQVAHEYGFEMPFDQVM